MENYYSTSQIARKAGIHPNTVRFYEEINFLPTIMRKKNGYRVFTDQHFEQLKLIKIAMKSGIVCGGLRETAINIVKNAAVTDFKKALETAYDYKKQIQFQKTQAEEAIEIIEKIISNTETYESRISLTRHETAEYFQISIDVLRNWERNGLITIPRKINGYRIYTEKEIPLLKVIRTLRNANYSMMSIRRMLTRIQQGTDKELIEIIDTPDPSEDIIYVTDKFITSLSEAEQDANQIIEQLNRMKK